MTNGAVLLEKTRNLIHAMEAHDQVEPEDIISLSEAVDSQLDSIPPRDAQLLLRSFQRLLELAHEDQVSTVDKLQARQSGKKAMRGYSQLRGAGIRSQRVYKKI